MPHTTVLIAGASLTGLTLANALSKLNIPYLVLEKHALIAPDIGASIALFANGFAVLEQLGCYDRLQELTAGGESFGSVVMRDSGGRVITRVERAAARIKERTGYSPRFLERRALIQTLYVNLPDKSRVLTGKGVQRVSTTPDGVSVHTSDGSVYTAALLVGADGIHSIVREEMTRLSLLSLPPGLLPKTTNSVHTTYRCIFGISPTVPNYPKNTTTHIQGTNHSYLLSTGPEGVVYFFLFSKLTTAIQGLDAVPRYTDAERDELAALHEGDRLSSTLTFGDVYRARRTATLQPLAEAVWERWHHGRIVVIGDAAHKYNPITGQGGNSALEDAAALATALHTLPPPDKQPWAPSQITSAFEATQNRRMSRVKKLAKKAHLMQRIQARDSWGLRIVGLIVGFLGERAVLDSLCADAGGVVVEGLPLPRGRVDRCRVSKMSTSGLIRTVLGCGGLILLVLLWVLGGRDVLSALTNWEVLGVGLLDLRST